MGSTVSTNDIRAALASSLSLDARALQIAATLRSLSEALRLFPRQYFMLIDRYTSHCVERYGDQGKSHWLDRDEHIPIADLYLAHPQEVNVTSTGKVQLLLYDESGITNLGDKGYFLSPPPFTLDLGEFARPLAQYDARSFPQLQSVGLFFVAGDENVAFTLRERMGFQGKIPLGIDDLYHELKRQERSMLPKSTVCFLSQ